MCPPVKRFRVTSAGLICASLMALAACGGEDAATTAGSTPTATTAAASPSAAAPTATAAAGGTSDKELCESANQAGEDMKTSLIAALATGDSPTPAVFKKILTDLNEDMSTLAKSGGDSKVVTALDKVSAAAAKASAATDPATAAEDPAFEKAFTELATACKPTGVKIKV
jgi:hypothetical protein